MHTLQHKLTEVRRKQFTEGTERLIENDHVKRAAYRAGGDAHAGQFLHAVPKTEGLTMQPAHFRQAVRNRLFIPHPGEAEVAGKPCPCPGAYNVDGLGLHMQKCKLEARLTIDMHNDVKKEIAALARFCGSTVRA